VTAADVFRVLKQNADTSRFVAASVLEDLVAAAAQGDLLAEEAGSMKFSIMPRSGELREEDAQKLHFILPAYF
jgi:5'-methylthioadenosine phosphorylase